MGDATTPHAWTSRVARRISSSSAARVLVAHVAAAPKARASAKREILDLLGDARPQAHAAVASTI
jgi:hypothetical protein